MASQGPPRRDRLVDLLRQLSIDLPGVLVDVPIPIYVLSRAGTIRWLNRAAVEVFGDRRGEHYSVVVAPEARQHVGSQFARKLLGTDRATSYETVLISRDGTKFHADLDTVRIGDDAEAVGVFGIAELERPVTPAAAPHVHLTPRQLEVLTLLAHGRSTIQIAEGLHLSKETVRNHVRGILRALAVHSRLEAVSRAHELQIV